MIPVLLSGTPLLAALLLVLSTADCTAVPACPAGFLGDPASPPEAVLLITDGISHAFKEVHAGDTIPLEPPPQGGYVFYVGARVRNLDACGVELRGTLRDPDNGNQVGYDARTTNLLATGNGWGQPDPGDNANVANVNGCPDYGPKDVQGQPYQLEMEVVDRNQRSAKVTVTTVPSCQFQNNLVQTDCLCTCSAHYCLGKCNPGAKDASVCGDGG